MHPEEVSEQLKRISEQAAVARRAGRLKPSDGCLKGSAEPFVTFGLGPRQALSDACCYHETCMSSYHDRLRACSPHGMSRRTRWSISGSTVRQVLSQCYQDLYGPVGR